MTDGETEQASRAEAASFEAILATVSARLLGAPLESMDEHITGTLSQLLALLEVERATLGVVDPVDGTLHTTHAVALPGLTPIPIGTSAERRTPWLVEQLREKMVPVIVARTSDLPPEAAVDVKTWHEFGAKSAAVFPIIAGESFLGAFTFGTTRTERTWPQPVVDRLRLIGEVFAGALLRRKQERKLRETRTEVETLQEHLQIENEYLRERTIHGEGFEDIIGESPALRRVLFQVEQVARTDATVLLLGETGTGKELIARAIHARSARRARALVTVNCAALSPTLIESELFGHEKGAFTGAVSRKIGRFEVATGSTLFLDEIGELALGLQAKLLRVLQEGEFERLGSSVTRKVDVRAIAASNRDLAAAAREGTFRPDLYYRLRVFPIQVPPLRARKEDIPVLVWHFLAQLGATLGKKIDRVPAPAMEQLLRYDWPGNVRELRNVLERAMILSPGAALRLGEFADDTRIAGAETTDTSSVRALSDVERDHILSVVESCDWRVRGPGNAAKLLGLNASTLYSRMKKLGIRRSPQRSRSRAGD